MKKIAILIACVTAACGGPPASSPDATNPPPMTNDHSSSIAIDASGSTIYVVNADSDSISILDAHARTLTAELALANRPAIAGDGTYTPSVMPRALALAPDGKTLYVTGERSGRVYAIDLATRAVRDAKVGSEPIGVVVSADGESLFVALSQDGKVVRVRASDLSIDGTADVGGEPWALAWSPSDGSLLVSIFMGPGAIAIDPTSMQMKGTWTIPDVAPRGDARLAHGAVRGLYDVAARPGTSEVWIAHAMLGIDTPQPALDFERTAFPSLSIFRAGAFATTLTTDAQDVPGIDGSFADIVSGPHAIAFTHDGALALVADSNSEDVLAVDAKTRVEAALARPLPGHQPEGIVISPDDKLAYVDQRNTGDVAVVAIDGTAISVDGATIPRFASGDPMPAGLRLGQHLFYSANSDEYPITKNHWVACATCHMEGRSDAVTWLFAQGPRDTPSNAGGMLGTGFLFRTADRNKVQDYWHTINVEQGGTFDPTAQAALLDALTDYVNHGIPLPMPPTTDPSLVAKGAEIFGRAGVGCAACHGGPRFTDSGAGNATLDLGGTIELHDVGTCVGGGTFPDVDHQDVEGHARAACAFDTPSLNGVASSPPYLHDGSAATLHDVLEQTRGKMGDISTLSADDEAALVEYLRSL
ncbi:MAG TPA: beta-propeller fold lactonase family protein [Kofleriaceae bacterium]|nr:beta-propeller fold lactonase family protein [Kofleriaceae bacterium]